MFKVKFMKYFTNGLLAGLSADAQVNFPTLESALEYTKFLLNHTEKPVEAYHSSDYTCHVIRIETA